MTDHPHAGEVHLRSAASPIPSTGSTSSGRTAPRNRLLAALPRSDHDRVSALMRPHAVKFHDILHRRGEPIRYIYFLGGGICSLIMPLADGRTVELAMIGREGVVGATATVDGNAQETALVQVGTEHCHRMTVADFRREMDRRGPLHDIVTRSGQAMLAFIMQSVACNALHPVEQRLCRWLLMAHDRVEADSFPMTQELIATMLGISRPTVTVVAGSLRKAGLIEYRHGRITLLNRQGLESGSCECYQVVNTTFETLVPESMISKGAKHNARTVRNRTDGKVTIV